MGEGFGASWFLDKIVITNMDTQLDTFFLCGRWLSKDEEDGQITRELPASNKDGQTYAPMINYKVSVITGSIRGAGTDANVFITIFGDSGGIPHTHPLLTPYKTLAKLN
jgi:hypothetical protein